MSDDATTFTAYDRARRAAGAIMDAAPAPPRIAIVLGTGLGGLATHIADPIELPYNQIPHFPATTVAGHSGMLVMGTLGGVPVAAMRGRFHLYEGYSPEEVALPVRALRLAGAEVLIVTNAAGGLDPAQQAGDLMLLEDHIGLGMMTGRNPLIGPNDERFGPRFPALTAAYDPALRDLARQVAQEQGTPLRSGVYIMLSGPNYETPAELRFLRQIGADAVGMSTVPEVLAARHMRMRVLAVSVITNVALAPAGAPPPEPNHAEVVTTGERAGAALAALIEGVISRL